MKEFAHGLYPSHNMSIPFLKSKGAGEPAGTRASSTLYLRVTGIVAVPLRSLRFKALYGTVHEICMSCSWDARLGHPVR